ncbi:MAG: PKD-like domain-containing protein [Flavobacteriales bacterium]
MFSLITKSVSLARFIFLLCAFCIYQNSGILYSQNCSVNLGPNLYVCSGNNVSITTTTNNFGGNPSYSWTVNGSNVNGNNSINVQVNNNPQTVICTVTSGNNNCSDADTMVIYPINSGAISGNQYVCNGSIPSIINSTNAGSTNLPNTTFAYQWQSAPNANGPWTNIPNETNSTYSPPPTQNTIYYRREFTLTVNGVDYPCYSNVITVSNISAPNINNPLCVNLGANANLSVTFNPSLATYNNVSATYAWTGPNNFTSSSANPTVNNVTAIKTGTYNVSVAISFNGNTICTYQLSTTINLNPPTPTFTLPATGCQGNVYSPTNFTPQPNTTYSWNISPSSGTAGSTGLNTATPNFVFTNVGSYSITVTATSNGCSSTSAPHSITMSNFNIDPPSVELNGSYYNVQVIGGQNTIAICAGLSITNINILNNNVSPNCVGGGCNPAGVTYTYSINGSNPAPFGAQVLGSINYGNNPLVISATYAGCTMTYSVNIYSGSNPYVQFGTNNSLGLCPGNTLVFNITPVTQTGQTNPPGTTYTVTFNDTPGNTSTFQNLTAVTPVSHTYNITSCGMTYPAGTSLSNNSFYAQLVAQNLCGQSTLIWQPITVNALPSANFTVSDSTICVNQTIVVTNTGNSGSVIGNSPPYNCSSQGKFYWTITGGVLGTNFTIPGTQSLGNYNANYGSLAGNGSPLLNVTFLTAGYYTITQYYYNSCGTVARVRNICVINPATCQFTTNPVSGCSPLTVNTNNTSTAPTCNGSPVPLGYVWTVSNQGVNTSSVVSAASAQNPTITLTNNTTTPQVFTVSLNVIPMEPAAPNVPFSTSILFCPIAISGTPTVGAINNAVSPWTATITGLSGAAGIPAGTQIMATNGTGSIGTGGIYTVNSSNASTINFTATGGNIPLAGTVTGLFRAISGTVSAPTSIGNGVWTSTITGLCSTTGISVGSVLYATNAGGSLGSGGIYTVTAVTVNSVTFTATGGTAPSAGVVTNLSVTSCTALCTQTVNVNPIPILTPTNITSCISPYTANVNLQGLTNMPSSFTWLATDNVNVSGESLTQQNTSSIQDLLTNNSSASQVITYSVTPTSTPVTAPGCVGQPQQITVTLNNIVPGTISSNQTICVGGDPVLLTGTAPAGIGTQTFQWQSSVDNINWTNIGVTTANYDPPVTNTTIYYRRIVTYVSNGVTCQGISNVVTITVNTVTSGTISAAQTLCQGGDPTLLSVVTNPTGAGTLSYQWQSSTTNLAGSYSNILGQTGTSYDPPPLNANTWYQLITTSSLNNVTCNATTPTILITVVTLNVGSIATNQTICVGGDPAAFTSVVATSNNGASIGYQWQSSLDNATWANIIGATAATYDPPVQNDTIWYRRLVTASLGGVVICSGVSNVLMITVINDPVITNPPLATQSICVGGTIGALTFSFSGGTGVASYQWYTVSGATYTAILNATNSSYTPPVFNTAATYTYAVIVNQNVNGCSSGYSPNAQVIVVPDPSVTNPSAATYCQNSATVAPLTVNASNGIAGLGYAYQWYSNSSNNTTTGTLIPGATSNTFTPPVGNVGNLYYYCIVTQPTGLGCSVTTTPALITVTAGPSFSAQPTLTQSVCLGGTASALSVSYVGGSGTPSYQWYVDTINNNQNGVLIPNATGSTYTPPVANTPDTLYYYCVISFNNNAGCSMIVSNTGRVITLADPTITVPPAGQTVCIGGTVSPALSFTFNGGTGTPSYQWYSVSANNTATPIANATAATYTPPIFNATANYNYAVMVNQNVSGCSTGLSTSAQITVVGEIVVTAPTGATYCQNAANVTALSVTASGGNGNAYTYQWYSTAANNNSSGTAIAGATSPTYTPSVVNVNTTYYYCIVSQLPTQNSCSTNSTQAAIIVNPGPTFSTQPTASQSVCVNGVLTPLSVVVSGGNGIPSYQWYFNNTNNNSTGTLIPGATSATYTLPAATQIGVTYYYCVITFAGNSGCASAISNLAQVTISNGPSISTPPLASQTVCVGGTISQALTVSISGGSGNPIYQWYTVSGGTYTAIANATSISYTPPIFNTQGPYNFAVLVNQSSGGCSTGYSSNATINVVADPTLSSPGPNASYCQNAGNVVPLSVTASGGIIGVPYTYQWYSNTSASTTNATLIPNATNSTYTPLVSSTGTLYYYCVVTQGSGIGCSFTSSFTSVAVTAGPIINGQPLANQTLCVGGTVSPLTISYTGGSGAGAYQWYSNATNSNTGGTAIAGATSSNYTPPVSNTPGTFYYYCEVSFGNNSGCSLIASSVATVNVINDPVITSAPNSQIICIGGTVSPALTVGFSGGSGTATYQWYSVSALNVYSLIPGATGSSYTPPTFNTAGNYSYSVIVTQNVSGCSSGQSNSATVTVALDPAVTAPTGATYCQNAGNVNALTVIGSGGNGTGMLYQWYSNNTNTNTGGTLIPSATSSSYIPPVANVGTTYYYCVVSQSPIGNQCITNSPTATFTVTSAPTFSTQPLVTQTLCAGGTATSLNVAYASGSGIPSYQWYSNNVNVASGGSSIAGATNSTFTPPSSTPGTLYYYCVLTFAQSGCSTITSNVATVIVNPGPSINNQPNPSQTVCVGGVLQNPLSITYTNGVGTASYQWYTVNGGVNTPIPNANQSTYTPPQFNTNTVINYMVQITLSGGGCGSIQSNLAQVNVVGDPIVTSPIGTQYCNGYNPVAALNVSATGGNGNSYAYQWYSNPSNNTTGGTAIAGANGNTYTPPVNINGTLYYYCVISQLPASSSCQTASTTAAITINAAPTILSQPTATQTVCVGGTLTPLTMTYSGASGNPSFQWYSNTINSTIGSSPIGGATASTYLPPNNLPGTLYYYCVINFPALSCSSITTAISSVIINADPSISSQPLQAQAVCMGTTIGTPLTINYTGGYGTPNYQWNIVNGGTATPIVGANGATFTPSIFNQAGTYNYMVTVSLSGNGCDAMQSALTQIIVSPVPTVNPVSSVTYCNADITPIIPFTGSIAGTTFAWQNSNINIGLAASGNGNLPSFTAANLNPVGIVGTITVTPQLITLGTTCSGIPTTFTITINPYQNVNDPQDLVLCHGTGVNGIQFSGTAAINNWTNDLPALGIGPSGSGTLPAFLAVNNGIAPIVANLSVTPSFNGVTTCPGDIETFTITILPAPTVTVPSSQIVCGGTFTNTINFTGTASSYQWTNSQPSIGLATNGTGNIPAFIASATGSNVVANIVVTPTYTFGGLTCSGSQQTTQITVIPTPTISNIINPVLCNGAPSGTINIIGNASSFPWTSNNISIGIPASGVGSIPSFNAINNGQSPIIATLSVTPTNTFGGLSCTAPVQSITITVNPTPTVNTIQDQFVCNQNNANPVVFSGNATGYTWTNGNTGIGLGSTGTGNIPAFNAINTQAIPVTANISVQPSYTFQGTTCTGILELFTITVLPTPTLSSIPNQTVCSGTATNAINFVGSGTNYIWSNNSPGIGLNANGSGNIPSFIASGSTLTTNATINIIPVYSFNNVSCYGANQSTIITVLPIPVVNQPPNLVVCNNASSGNVVFSGNATNITWSNPNPLIGIGSSGIGNIPSFIASNNGISQSSTTITLNPQIVQNGLTCNGNPTSFNIVINPTPTINSINDISVCHQSQTIPLNFSGNATGYQWTNSLPSIGLPSSGFGSILPFTAVNNSNSLATALIQVTPAFAQSGLTCYGSIDSIYIYVEPIPTIQYGSLAQTICSGNSTTAVSLNTSYVGSVLSWTITSNTPFISGINPFSGTGNLPAMTLTNSSNSPIQITYQGTATTPLAGCTATGPNGTITINPAPTMVLINDTTICNNSMINIPLNANINSTFTWGAANNVSVNGESIGPITSNSIFNFLQNTTSALQTVVYTVTPSSFSTGCSGTSITFSVDVVPDIVLTNPSTYELCSGDPTGIYLTSNLPANFTWQAINQPSVQGETILQQTGFYINDVLTNGTVYDQVVDYQINSTSGTYTCFGIPSIISVTVHPQISLTNANSLTICSGDNVGLALAATVNSTFVWSATNNGIVTGESLSAQNTDIIDDILINNSTVTQQVNYTIDATSIDNGCSESNLPLTILVNPLPFISNNDTTICSGQPVNMTINTAISANVSWYGLISPTIYGETTTSSYTPTITDILVNSSPNVEIIDYVLSASANGCFAPNDTIQVSVLVPPTVNFTVNTNPLCSNSPISFINQSPPIYQFNWTFGDGTNSTTYSPTHSYPNSGNYLVILEATNQNNNCTDADSALIAVNKSPIASFFTNDTSGCGDLNATFFTNYQPDVTYFWDFGNGETSTQVGNVTNYYDTEGCYTITLSLTSPEGCVNQSIISDYVCIYDYPIAAISASPLEVSSLNPEVQFYNYSQNAISYTWVMGDGTLSYDDNPTYTFANWAADYNVMLTAYNEIGCIDTASISINVYEDLIVYTPNSFTPNDDEENQLFYPVLAQGFKKDFIEFYIYNRWGELVFESHDPNIGWDGSYGNSGRDCQIGTYTWILKVKSLYDQDVKEFTGHVNLIK